MQEVVCEIMLAWSVEMDEYVCSCPQGGVEALEKHNSSRRPGDFGY